MRSVLPFILFIFFFVTDCIEPYNPPVIENNDNYLVVEGYLDIKGSSTIKLTQTIPLSSNEEPTPVTDASLIIEDDGGSQYIFIEGEDGVYTVDNVAVNFNSKYRLIVRDGGDEYASDFVAVTRTPPIESVDWKMEKDMVKIYVNTTGLTDGSRYYQWKLTETWEYSSAFRSFYKYQDGSITERGSPVELYFCWKSDQSPQINVSSTTGLEQNIVSNYLLRELSTSSKQFQTRYSILVSQRTLSSDAYEYWGQVRDNTSGTGSLFDVQPSRVTGNIRNTGNGKPAIGYFSVSEFKEKRIFISRFELPVSSFKTGYEYCALDTLLEADIPNFIGGHLIVDELVQIIESSPRNPPMEIFLGYKIATPFCVDCRLTGGETVRPDYW